MTIMVIIAFLWYSMGFLGEEQPSVVSLPVSPCRAAPPVDKDYFSFLCEDPAVSFLQISPSPPSSSSLSSSSSSSTTLQRPKVLCVVLTHSNNHKTRMKAVVETWGRKCDMLIGASNVTDPQLYTYNMEESSTPSSSSSPSVLRGYWGIWDKLMHTLQRIVENKFPEPLLDYDWILKADDDTYVIMENLQAFLMNISQVPSSSSSSSIQSEPRIYGRTMAWPRLKRFQDMEGWFPKHSENYDFGQRFYAKLGVEETLRFSHGGPGYIMNRKYVEMLVQAYFNTTTTTTTTSTNGGSGGVDAIKGEVAEDIANAVTMLYHGVRPRSTFDFASGRERMHPESPQTMFANPIWLEKMHHGIKGSLKGEGEQCCSPTSISYHYVADFQMRLLEYQLYHCPRDKTRKK